MKRLSFATALLALCFPAAALADPDTLIWNNGVAASDSWHTSGIWTPTTSTRTLPDFGGVARIGASPR